MEYTKCFNCTEPTKKILAQSSNFYTDNGLVFECNADCVSSEKEHNEAIQAVLEIFRKPKSANKENKNL